jgi:hypothetical protein
MARLKLWRLLIASGVEVARAHYVIYVLLFVARFAT